MLAVNISVEAWDVAAIGAIALLLLLSAMLALWECGVLPFRRIAMLRRRSLAELALVAVIVGVNGGASLTAWTPSGDPESVSERMAVE